MSRNDDFTVTFEDELPEIRRVLSEFRENTSTDDWFEDAAPVPMDEIGAAGSSDNSVNWQILFQLIAFILICIGVMTDTADFGTSNPASEGSMIQMYRECQEQGRDDCSFEMAREIHPQDEPTPWYWYGVYALIFSYVASPLELFVQAQITRFRRRRSTEPEPEPEPVKRRYHTYIERVPHDYRNALIMTAASSVFNLIIGLVINYHGRYEYLALLASIDFLAAAAAGYWDYNQSRNRVAL